MRILFMGTPDFSVPTLKNLIDSKHEVVAVVTQPDQPKGRGKIMSPTPVKEVALAHGIPVYQPVKVRETSFLEELKLIAPDIIVVIAFGQILSKTLLEIPPKGCINIHASLLPKYRGAAPIQWCVINGEKVTGLTTMFMDVGIDTGDMLHTTEIPLALDETGGSLHDKLSVLGGPLLLKTIDQIENQTLVRNPQNHNQASYAPMLDKKLGHINWHQNAVEIERLIRGLSPWPSAYTYLGDKMLKLWKAEIVETPKGYLPGTICDIQKDKGFVIQCKDNGLLIKELQLQGKSKMDTLSFLRGVQLKLGTQLQ